MCLCFFFIFDVTMHINNATYLFKQGAQFVPAFYRSVLPTSFGIVTYPKMTNYLHYNLNRLQMFS